MNKYELSTFIAGVFVGAIVLAVGLAVLVHVSKLNDNHYTRSEICAYAAGAKFDIPLCEDVRNK